MSTFSSLQQFIDTISARFNVPRRSATSEGVDKQSLLQSLLDVGIFVSETNSETFIQESIAEAANHAEEAGKERETAHSLKMQTQDLFNSTNEILTNAIQATNPLGDYNATTNLPALTAVPPAAPGVPKGSFYTITESGSAGFTGSNFLSGAALAIGGRIVKKSETEWYYQKPLDSGYEKIIAVEPKVAKLNPFAVYTPVIKQSPTNNYQHFTVGTGTKEQRVWLFAKSAKQLDRIGVFIFKRSSTGTITSDVRIQVLIKRGAASSKIVDKVIAASTLSSNDDFDTIIGGTQGNFEVMVDFPAATILTGDQIFVSIHCESGLHPFFATENKDDPTGEWNNGTGLHYRTWGAQAEVAFTTVPALPTAETSTQPLNFYERGVELERVKTLESRVTSVETGKATVTNALIPGVQKFDKANYVAAGKGIGFDGVIFSSAAFGSMIDQPVKASTTYVFSGLSNGVGRGLLFIRANGTLISFQDYIANGTPFTTPAETAKISVQLWSNTNPSAADLVMLSECTVPQPLEAYSASSYVTKANGLGIQAEVLASGSKMNGSKVVTEIDLTPVKERVTNLEALGNPATDFTYIAPANVYVPQNEINGYTSRKEPVLLYLQRFIRDKKEMWLEKGKNFIVMARNAVNSTTVVQELVSFTVGGGQYLTKTINVNRVTVNTSVLASQFPKVGWIGDSITDFRPKNGATTNVGAGSMHGFTKEIAMKNRIDNGNVGYEYLLMGRSPRSVATLSYKGNNLSWRQFADGAGGWAASTWLRHPTRVWVQPAGFWDLLGLVTSQGRAYSATPADRLLLTKTCWGVNTPVISNLAYNALVAESLITDLGTWTGSSPQIAAVQAWIDNVNGGNASNRYFDPTKTGSNRFNVAKYLSEWKTLASDGLTRLVVGSTAGSKVLNATDHDVCEPTHVVICLGENDSIFISNYPEIVNDILELATEITSQLPSCHVAICLTGIPGPMFPERHPNYIGLFNQSAHNRKYDLQAELQSRFGNLASQVANRIYLLPTYYAGTPLSHSNVSEQVDEATGQTIYVANDDYNHPGYYANRSAGAQIYGWVAYTKTL